MHRLSLLASGTLTLLIAALLLSGGCGRRQSSEGQNSKVAANVAAAPTGGISTVSSGPGGVTPVESRANPGESTADGGRRPGTVDGGIPGDPEDAAPAVSAPAATNGRSGPYQRPEDAPLAPMGRKLGASALAHAPGYQPPNDPEAESVRTGRRQARVVDIPFKGGESSPERLAQAILDGLRVRDFNALRALRVTPDEFSDIMWPEFPESRPICNSNVNDAYFFLDRHCHSGITLGLDDWGGQELKLLGITYEIGRAPYTNFVLYRGVRIHVLKTDGSEGVMKFACTFAERKGVWKVYAYKDKD